MAATIVPLVAVRFLLNRYIVEGAALGGEKNKETLSAFPQAAFFPVKGRARNCFSSDRGCPQCSSPPPAQAGGR